jgi:hypothetical protein
MIKYGKHNLAKGSQAVELYEKKDFEKLDKHLKEVEGNYLKARGGPMPEHLVNYKIGEHPEDIARAIEQDRCNRELEERT